MTPEEKQKLSERDICTKFITPAIINAGWDNQLQIREEVTFTAGKVIVRGKLTSRGKQKRADYILFAKPNLPLAIIEAKENSQEIGSGMQQALEYGEILDVPFIFSSNGDGFIEHDRTVKSGKLERDLGLTEFPSPAELWKRYCHWKGFTLEQEQVISEPYYMDMNGKEPRYYQRVAINRTVEAIAKGQNRILLVMATGTGKTYTAFQIIYRLWKSRQKKRILFLCDRNILADQTKNNDFKPFGSVMTKISSRKVDKSYEVYLALYQGITGPDEDRKTYKQFSADFFDLIIIDEAHRGSANEDSEWREVLEYFAAATQIGLTATPKETKYVSNTHYFGEPVFTYSLKDGIEDGFLAPYKVARISLDRDVEGWRPAAGKKDKYGKLVPDKVYNQSDYDRDIVLEKRTEAVAKKITQFLTETDRFDKTIVFCVDIDHAERMRQALVNENPGLVHANSKYIMRITGDNEEGKSQLEYFIAPESKYPVIVTTSRLMSTGVDARTCKLIVLDREIKSMTEFKQIIGRGTRIEEDYGKTWFTIMDFRKATELFADPDFDGLPEKVYEPQGDESPVPPDENPPADDEKLDGELADDLEPEHPEWEPGFTDKPTKRKKYVINDVPVFVMGERIQYYGADGKLITESLKEYTKNTVFKDYRTLNEFLNKWTSAEKKEAVIKELEENGVIFAALEDEVGKDLDAFDLICHVAFGQPPLTRHERVNNVKKRNYFGKYSETAQKVLEALLEKYQDKGISDIENMNILKLPPINELGTPVEIIKSFGSKEQYQQALNELEQNIYQSG